MPTYRLQYRPLSADHVFERLIEAPDLAAAYGEAARAIAEAHGMPEVHVDWNRDAGTVTVGAGYWSRRGTYSLELGQGIAEPDRA